MRIVLSGSWDSIRKEIRQILSESQSADVSTVLNRKVENTESFQSPSDSPETTSTPAQDEDVHQKTATDTSVNVDVATNTEVDAGGASWDERFHSQNRTKTQDGRWRLKKGVTKEDVSFMYETSNDTDEESESSISVKSKITLTDITTKMGALWTKKISYGDILLRLTEKFKTQNLTDIAESEYPKVMEMLNQLEEEKEND